MRTVFSGTLAGFQIPAGFLAERFGTAAVLALGATTVEYEDTSHRYLRAPGGQIFRLAVVK